jgi:glutamate-5-semialdehyde dehydrogenase
MTGSKEKQLTTETPNSAAVLVLAQKAKQAANIVAGTSGDVRNEALLAIAGELASHETEILEANAKDLGNAAKLLAQGELTQALVDRLKLDHNKLAAVISGIRQIAKMPDPIGKVDLDRELDTNLELQRITCPIGLIGVIFEARPEALPQIAALCLKSANGIILKGGAEAEHCNRILFDCVKQAAVRAGLPADCLVLLESRADVSELLKADRFVDLIIPRGSNSLVRHIQDNTRIPVLGHAEGVCHVYVDSSADLEKAMLIICDAKAQYPAACNAAETILIHESIAPSLMPKLLKGLADHKVRVRCDSQALALAGEAAILQSTQLQTAVSSDAVSPATDKDWGTEYGDLIVAIKIVHDLTEAIEHINRYGSGHTEAMIAEDTKTFDQFFAQINSAGVFLNASTRFADGFRYGFGAEIGISTAKQHPRGPVGIEGLITYKYKLIGNGHVVADYVGSKAKQFTHRDLKQQPKQDKQ